MYASLTGVRKQLAVPKTIRWMTKDKLAARDCANKILAWPIERIVVAHNAIIEKMPAHLCNRHCHGLNSKLTLS